METLSEICLDNVSANLALNYKLCKNLNIALPEKLCVKIYFNSYANNSKFTNDDVNFFGKDIMELKDVNLTRKQFKYVSNFEFLNGQKLDNLILGRFNRFKVNSKKNFELVVKNLKLYNFVYRNTEIGKLNWLFKKMKVTDKIEFCSKTLFILRCNIKRIYDCLSDEISEIYFNGIMLNFHSFVQLMESVADKNCLKKLNLNLEFFQNDTYVNETKFKCEMSKTYTKNFNYLPKSLESLHFYMSSHHSLIFSCLPTVFNRLKNLKSFHINTMPMSEWLCFRVLHSLKVNCCENLNEICLGFESINIGLGYEIIDLIEKCRCIKKFDIYCFEEFEKYIKQDVLNALKIHASNLETIEIANNAMAKKEFENIIVNATSLKRFNYGSYLYNKPSFECLRKLNECIRDSLEVLLIYFIKYTKNISENLNLGNFRNLTEIRLGSIKFQDDTCVDLFEQFENGNYGENLKLFFMHGLEFNEVLSEVVGKFLVSCKSLETFIFENINMDSTYGRDNIFSGLKYCKNTLKKLYLNNCNMNDSDGYALGDILKEFKTLKKLKLTNNRISGDCFVEILKSLKLSRKTLEKFDARFCRLKFEEKKMIKQEAKKYNKLEFIKVMSTID